MRLFWKIMMVIGIIGFLGSAAAWLIIRHVVLND